MIYIESIYSNIDYIKDYYGNPIIINVSPFIHNGYLSAFSPYYPHGNIRVPVTPQYTAVSVQAVWQGLKVFENNDIDINTFKMKNPHLVNRSTKQFGNLRGFRKGVNGDMILNLAEARKELYIPIYRQILDYHLNTTIAQIRESEKYRNYVLLDDYVLFNIDNCNIPLSHAALIKAYIKGTYPYEDVFGFEEHFHTYIGRKYYQWKTYERKPKSIPPFNISNQLTIDFSN